MTSRILRRIHYADSDEVLEKPFEFQITNIRAGDTNEVSNDDDETSKCYRIQLFGLTKGGHTVHLCIDDFTPYFFVEVPDNYNQMTLKGLINNLKKKMKEDLAECLLEDMCKIVLKEKLIGFTNHKKFKFVRLVFSNQEAMKNCMYKFNYGSFSELTLHETNIEPVMRFLHIRNIEPAGWVKVNDYNMIKGNKSTCHVHIEASYHDIFPSEDQERLAPIMCCAFDIECTSLDGSFPDPSRDSDDCIMIASIFRKYPDTSSCLKVVHTLKKCDPIDDVVIIECQNEEELLLLWRKMLQTMDADFMYGYNSNGFDWWYIHERAKRYSNSYNKFMKLSRNKDEQVEYQIKKLSSSALGDNVHKYIDMTGRIILDVMKEVQKDFKLDMWKLDFVANKFLGSNKVDLSPAELFRKYNEVGTPEAMKEIAIYCIQDTELCNDLVWKLSTIIKAIKMANVCSVPAEYIFYRGQGVKIFSLVAKECRNAGIIIPVIRKPYNLSKEEEEKRKEEARYQGALVIETDGGLYYEPVVVLDFTSLYPSCILGWNISHDTIVLDPRYDNIEGIKYENIQYTDYDGKETVCRYVQVDANGVSNKGIFLIILKKLLDTRKEFKKKMKAVPETSFEHTLLNGSQLAYKVVANSCYGQCGATTSPIYYKNIAASTTAKGREMLMRAKEVGENSGLNVECVYGDSVMGYTPILLQDYKGNIIVKTIEELGKVWVKYDNFKPFEQDRTDKLQSITDYKVWSDQGWTPIKKVIKHKVSKKIYRITTHYGIVDVTEDHSLVDKDLNIVKPEDCYGDIELLHSFPNIQNDDEIDMEIFDKKYKTQLECMKDYVKLARYKYGISLREYHGFYHIDLIQSDKTTHVSLIGYTNDFVYDLETECGRFQAGIGQIIVKNTDSNFYLCKGLEGLPKVEQIKKAMDIGHKMSKIINKALGKEGIINFAYEKVLFPHLQITKKKYYSMLYEDDPTKGRPNGMGLATKRRNYCKFSKEIMQGVLDRIMAHEKEGVIEFVQEKLHDLIQGRVNLELLRMTQTLKSDYKQAPAHHYLAQRMKARGETVNSNDRIPYIYAMHPPVYNTRGNPVKKQMKDVIEEYNYVKNQGLNYDPEIYIDSQIKEPVMQIMQFIVDNPEEIFNNAIKAVREDKYKKYGQPVKALTKAQLAKLEKDNVK